MGWIPDLPDLRDFTVRHEAILSLLSRLERSPKRQLPDEVDLYCDEDGEYFTTPENQGTLHCSASFAVLSLVEYFERRIHGRTFEGSKLFLYKVTRNALLGRRKVSGDTGADLRTTLKVFASVGVPSEEFWPYEIEKFDEEPSPFVYSMAKRPTGFCYFRLDDPTQGESQIWENLKAFLAAGFPIAFGFPVPSNLSTSANILYRANLDSIRGGQAVVAVGYRVNHFGRGQHALRIRSSWGSRWGDNGNGWLPLSFIHSQLARDFWVILGEKWMDSSELECPSIIAPITTKPLNEID